MKTWEMIKELTENPNKKFKTKNEKDNYVAIIDGFLVWEDGTEFNLNLDVQTHSTGGSGTLNIYEWEEVKRTLVMYRGDLESLVGTLELNIQSLENREINTAISSLMSLRNNIEKNLGQ